MAAVVPVTVATGMSVDSFGSCKSRILYLLQTSQSHAEQQVCQTVCQKLHGITIKLVANGDRSRRFPYVLVTRGRPRS